MESSFSFPQTYLTSRICSTSDDLPRFVLGVRRPYYTVPMRSQCSTCRNTSDPIRLLTEFQLGLKRRSYNAVPTQKRCLMRRNTVVKSESRSLVAAASHSTDLRFDSKCAAYSTILPWNQHFIRRNTLVRSEVVRAGSADAAYPLTESQWRLKLRGLSFYAVTSILAISLFVVMVVCHPFVLLFDLYQRKVHHVIAKIWASLTVTLFFGVEFEGLENLPPADCPAVYVSNHQSFLDIYTLLTLGRSFKFISKTGIFVIPVVGWAMFLMGLIPLRRMDTKSQLDCFKRCIDLVKKGASIFFFPEGTRSKDGKLGSFKKGAFSVATKTGVPVVPITLMGTGDLMPAGKEDILNTGSVKVVIHKPMGGSDPELLCGNVRNVIADVLLRHGYGVH